MKKIYCIISQVVLLIWFFLDMTGLYFGDKCLVTTSYKDDGLFFLIYLLIRWKKELHFLEHIFVYDAVHAL